MRGLAELDPNSNGSCAYDPGNNRWEEDHELRFSVMEDLNCTREVGSFELPNGGWGLFSKQVFVTDLYPNLQINFTTTMVDSLYIQPIVPGYNATYSPEKIKFDLDVANWPWVRGDTNVAVFVEAFFPPSDNFEVTANSTASQRTIQYKSNGAILTMSTDTDFLADGVHYRTASDLLYQNISGLITVPFGIGFCHGTKRLQWQSLSYDPTLSYLFPAAETPDTPETVAKGKKNGWIPIVASVLVVALVAAIASGAIVFYLKRGAKEAAARDALTTRSSSRPIHQTVTRPETTSEVPESSSPQRGTWAPAAKPS
jgi:hypothetical protein